MRRKKERRKTNCQTVGKLKIPAGGSWIARSTCTPNVLPIFLPKDPAGKMLTHRMKSYWASGETAKAAGFSGSISWPPLPPSPDSAEGESAKESLIDFQNIKGYKLFYPAL